MGHVFGGKLMFRVVKGNRTRCGSDSAETSQLGPTQEA